MVSLSIAMVHMSCEKNIMASRIGEIWVAMGEQYACLVIYAPL